MKNNETITEQNYRLRQEALQSKDNSKSFRYLANGVNKVITKNQ